MNKKKVIFTIIVVLMSLIFSLQLYSKQLYRDINNNYKVHGDPLSFTKDVSDTNLRMGARIATSKTLLEAPREEFSEIEYSKVRGDLKQFRKDNRAVRNKIVLASIVERLRDPFVLFSLLSIIILIKAIDVCYKDSNVGYYLGVFFIILIVTQICLFSTKEIVANFYSETTQEIITDKNIIQIKDALIKVMQTPINR